MKTLLVSLVSDQTLPNIQIIKELGDEITEYLFISTKGMEKKGCRRWIEKTTNIISLPPLIVDQFSFSDIISKLNGFDFSQFDRLVVNLTGGTKIMTIAAHDYFKEKNAEILYVTGSENKYLKLYPEKKDIEFSIHSKITVSNYLTAYGFEIEMSKQSGINNDYTQNIFNLYCEGELAKYTETINALRKYRNKGVRSSDFEKIPLLTDFLQTIKFKAESVSALNAIETKYLTGEWFEEYIGATIKNTFSLTENELLIGAVLRKEVEERDEIYSVKNLLGDEAMSVLKYPDNEIDVMFILNGKFYTVECKTAIIDLKDFTVSEKGVTVTKQKEINILGETIYKVDSLRNKFGLYANSFIFTLTSFAEYSNQKDAGIRKNRIKQMVDNLNRASLSKIRIADKDLITNTEFKQLLY